MRAQRRSREQFCFVPSWQLPGISRSLGLYAWSRAECTVPWWSTTVFSLLFIPERMVSQRTERKSFNLHSHLNTDLTWGPPTQQAGGTRHNLLRFWSDSQSQNSVTDESEDMIPINKEEWQERQAPFLLCSIQQNNTVTPDHATCWANLMHANEKDHALPYY